MDGWIGSLRRLKRRASIIDSGGDVAGDCILPGFEVGLAPAALWRSEIAARYRAGNCCTTSTLCSFNLFIYFGAALPCLCRYPEER